MKSTVVKVDLTTKGTLKKGFVGGMFRGWLGHALKCNSKKSCLGCEDVSGCPYYMVFKEQNDVKPYSIMAFKDQEHVCGFIRLHGDRRKFAPRILANIKNMDGIPHFGGLKYTIDSIEAKNIEIRPVKCDNEIRVVTTSPIHLKRNGKMEVIPTLSTILHSCVRSYNRISKYYDSQNYPFHVNEEVTDFDADITDFDVHTVKFEHLSMGKKKITMEGIEGWVKYDVSSAPDEIGMILGMGESLQIGKHTAYGFGGFMILGQEE